MSIIRTENPDSKPLADHIKLFETTDTHILNSDGIR